MRRCPLASFTPCFAVATAGMGTTATLQASCFMHEAGQRLTDLLNRSATVGIQQLSLVWVVPPPILVLPSSQALF